MGFTKRLPATPEAAEILHEDQVEDFLEDDEEGAQAAPVELRLGPEAGGERLDKVLSKLLPQYSRSRLQQWIESGHVSVDGQPARTKTVMLGDETVLIHPQPAAEDEAF